MQRIRIVFHSKSQHSKDDSNLSQISNLSIKQTNKQTADSSYRIYHHEFWVFKQLYEWLKHR